MALRGLAMQVIHPRLFFSRGERDSLKAKIEQHQLCARGWEEIRSKAEQALDKQMFAEPEYHTGQRQHGNFLQAADFAQETLIPLGFAHFLIGDRRYRDCALRFMEEFANWQTWTWPGFAERNPPWNSSLETVHILESMAIAWDCFYDELEEDLRFRIKGAIIEKGIQPLLADWLSTKNRIHSLESMGHNWWAVCITGAALGALALLGHWEEAQPTIELAAEGINSFFHYPGSPLLNKRRTISRQGGCYESVSYLSYPLRHLARLEAAYHRLMKKTLDFPEEIQKSSSFFLGTLFEDRKGRIKHLGFGDNKEAPIDADTVSYLAAKYADPNLQWYLQTVYSSLPTVFSILWHDPSVKVQGPEKLPTTFCDKEIGWLISREKWCGPSTVFGIKAGYTWNHAHADAGSFFLAADGVPLIVDSGTCAYSNILYRDYFVSSKAHNIILIGGEGQMPEDIDRGSKNDGKITAYLDTPVYKYILADLQGPYSHLCRRYFRSVFWAGNQIGLFDELLLNKPDTVQWLLHYEGEAQRKESTFFVNNQGKQVKLIPLFPETCNMSKAAGYLSQRENGQIPQAEYLNLETPLKAREHKILNILEYGANLSMNTTRRIKTDKVMGWGTGSLAFLYNTNADGSSMNTTVEYNGFVTDAYQFVLSEELDVWGVHHGSLLRNKKQTLLSFFAPVHFVKWADSGLCIRLICDTPQPLWFYWPQKPQELRLNGAPISFTYDQSSCLIKIWLNR